MTTEFAWNPAPESPHLAAPARSPRTGLVSSRSWAELLYVIIDLAPAIAFFVLIVTLLSVGVGLAIVYIGIPILALGLLVARLGGLVQRSMAFALLDLPSVAPGWAQPRRPGPISALAAVLRDPAGWRAVAYFVIKMVLAPATFSVAVGLYAWGLGALTYPLWRLYLPLQAASDGSLHRGAQWWPDFFIDDAASMVVFALIGWGVLWCAPRIVTFLTTIDRVLIGSLLTNTSTAVLR
jgi:Putative sensor